LKLGTSGNPRQPKRGRKEEVKAAGLLALCSSARTTWSGNLLSAGLMASHMDFKNKKSHVLNP